MSSSAVRNGIAGSGSAVIAAMSVMLLVPQPAQGAPVDTSWWECNFCPFEDGEAAVEAEAGSLYADGASARFGEFDSISEDGGYLVLDGNAGARRADGSFWRAATKDLGLDNRSVAVAAGHAGRWQLDAGYAASPYNRYDTTVTPFVAGD